MNGSDKMYEMKSELLPIKRRGNEWIEMNVVDRQRIFHAASTMNMDDELFNSLVMKSGRIENISNLDQLELTSLLFNACQLGELNSARDIFSVLKNEFEPNLNAIVELCLLEIDQGHFGAAAELLKRTPLTAMRSQLQAEIKLKSNAPEACFVLAHLLREYSKATRKRIWRGAFRTAASRAIVAEPDMLGFLVENCHDDAIPFILTCALESGLIENIDRKILLRIKQDINFWSALVGRKENLAKLYALAEINCYYLSSAISGISYKGTDRENALFGICASPSLFIEDFGKVSIILCAFNSQETIEYSIKSICMQGYENLEVIVVDDFSDQPLDIDKKWFNGRDFKIHRNLVNLGPYASRNIGLELACGSIIGFHDGDDWAHPDKISHQIFEMQRTGAVAHYGSVVRIRPDGMIAPENNGSFLGDGPITGFFNKKVFEQCGKFSSVRTRGDIEFRRRITSMLEDGAVSACQVPYVLALDWQSNSKMMTNQEVGWRKISKFLGHASSSVVLANFFGNSSELNEFIDKTMPAFVSTALHNK